MPTPLWNGNHVRSFTARLRAAPRGHFRRGLRGCHPGYPFSHHFTPVNTPGHCLPNIAAPYRSRTRGLGVSGERERAIGLSQRTPLSRHEHTSRCKASRRRLL
eukprot:3102599-Prymnesium_polylepis.1